MFENLLFHFDNKNCLVKGAFLDPGEIQIFSILYSYKILHINLDSVIFAYLYFIYISLQLFTKYTMSKFNKFTL